MDIFFLAVLTFYIFFKLSKHLGRIDEDEKKQIEEKVILMKAAQEKIQDIIQNQEKLVGNASTAANSSSDELENLDLDQSAKSDLKEILSACNINLEFFLSGAKSAFEMIIKSFASGDLETLKNLLANNLYTGFESAVNQRKLENKTLTTNLISIDKSDIIAASLQDNMAVISVKFISQQINYVELENGEVIDGSKNEISEVTDIWTFKKDTTDSNPNWTISATGN